MTNFTRTPEMVKKYQLIRRILWHSRETGHIIIDTFAHRSEAYAEWDAQERCDELDRAQGNLPSYIEYDYEVKIVYEPQCEVIDKGEYNYV